jgi:uncharacterized surface protein with fasciclin (FAS1) repeats
MLLLPATLHAQPQDCGSIIARDPQLSRAIQALQRTGILENLRGLGPVTVFAVTDQGIARQPEDLAQMLFPIAGGSLGGPDIDPVLAPAVVNAHIVDGRIGADQLRPGMSLRSRSGGTIEVVAEQGGQLALRPGPGGFSVGARPADAHIVQPDIGCTNGVVHKIDHVLVR